MFIVGHAWTRDQIGQINSARAGVDHVASEYFDICLMSKRRSTLKNLIPPFSPRWRKLNLAELLLAFSIP